jgi:hypothetical protein
MTENYLLVKKYKPKKRIKLNFNELIIKQIIYEQQTQIRTYMDWQRSAAKT